MASRRQTREHLTIDIAAGHVLLHADDGTMQAYHAAPQHASSNTPGIVLAMHVWGMDESMRAAARRLARAGFAVLAPDLYSRFGAPSGDGVNEYKFVRSFAAKLKRQRKRYGTDLRIAADSLLKSHPNAKVGILGFSMGGRIALEQLVDHPEIYGAASVFYGAMHVDPTAIATPIVGSYAAHDEAPILAVDVRTFVKALGVLNDVRIYPGVKHGFCDETRSTYAPAEAADAWMRTIAFLRRCLQPA